jgi:DNA helicase-2/ATP-dependent DNA helicase PcrA
MDFVSSLNKQQREAVEAEDGPLLVLAGAGSGKTRVITVRIAYLIAVRGVAPYNILAVTFTNKAAGEMRDRVEQMLKDKQLTSAPLISTFHSLCVRILRADIEHLGEGFTRSFTIYDTDDSQKLIKTCVKELGLDEKQYSARSTQSAISAAKNRGEDHELYAAGGNYNTDKRSAIARVFKAYTEKLRQANALDFDDLLIKTVQLLKNVDSVREKYNERYKHLLVDEYQDTNSLQFNLIRLLTEKRQNIMVVGDDAQSIYSFRGADIGNILSFEKHFADAKTILLEQNYRSTQTILDTADAVIAHNKGRKEKKLWTEQTGGEKIKYFQAADSDLEARFVSTNIERHLAADPRAKVAVLYRTNAQSRLFEEALRRQRIGYNIVGGFSFYERAEVKDVIAYLKLALNPHDSIALLRVINTPPRGLGKTTLDELNRAARETQTTLWETIAVLTDPAFAPERRLTPRAIEALKKFRAQIAGLIEKIRQAADGDRPVTDAVVAAIEDTSYANALRAENSDESLGRLENLEELANAATEYDRAEGGLREFIDHAALVSDTDKYDQNAPVTLMTVHAAKGLEFPVVFLAGLEDGVFPHSRSINDPQALEEERRLCYVAITRAEKTLYITHAARRRIYGESIFAEPSQFLQEMPSALMEDLSDGESWLSYAQSGRTVESLDTINTLRGLRPQAAPWERKVQPKEQPKARSTYAGKTYDTADAINEFFRSKGKTGLADKPDDKTKPQASFSFKERFPEEQYKPAATPPAASSQQFAAGARVRHAKYGKGLVLRREGAGDNIKLTVSFPGYGLKKLVEKYANLEPA